mgnify:CR=1 FL=1
MTIAIERVLLSTSLVMQYEMKYARVQCAKMEHLFQNNNLSSSRILLTNIRRRNLFQLVRDIYANVTHIWIKIIRRNNSQKKREGTQRLPWEVSQQYDQV